MHIEKWREHPNSSIMNRTGIQISQKERKYYNLMDKQRKELSEWRRKTKAEKDTSPCGENDTSNNVTSTSLKQNVDNIEVRTSDLTQVGSISEQTNNPLRHPLV